MRLSSQLNRLIKFFLLAIISFYNANCQRIDYNAVRVKSIIDGDTIVLSNNQYVRYIGIDTPELRRRIGETWIYEPMPFAEESKEFNRDLVEGKAVRLEFDVEKKDKYNRLLAYCFVGETFVNAKLLEEGLALLYTRVPNVKYADLFVRLQKAARENKKGIWQGILVIPPEKAENYLGRIETVEGRVTDVSVTESAIYLNFGKNHKQDFTAVIFKDDLDMFDKDMLLSHNFYKGRKLRITGLIKEYNGPEIIVGNPSQIEFLN